MIRFLYLSVVFSCVSSSVYAYIDLGTGSMITQFVIASVAGVLLFIKDIWRGLLSFIKRLRKHDKK